MDFFEHQAGAQRRSRWLFILFFFAVVGVVLSIHLVVSVFFSAGDSQGARIDSLTLFLIIGTSTSGVILLGTLYKLLSLRGGGRIVAEMAGGRRVASTTTDPDEQRLMNVVEEMSIASGIPVPDVYLLDIEEGINAFAAGYQPSEAVVAVTRGALMHLTRDELQGVVAHEFSHIMYGDMRLNVRMLAILHGLFMIATLGNIMLRSVPRRRSRSDAKAVAIIICIGLCLWIIGSIGVLFGRLIRLAISRQREFLADAAAAQFTRNPSGLAGALKKIAIEGSSLVTPRSEEFSHFFFAEVAPSFIQSLLSSHPPIKERLRRLGEIHLEDIAEVKIVQDTGASYMRFSSADLQNRVGSVALSPVENSSYRSAANAAAGNAGRTEGSSGEIMADRLVATLETAEGAENLILALLTISHTPPTELVGLSVDRSAVRGVNHNGANNLYALREDAINALREALRMTKRERDVTLVQLALPRLRELPLHRYTAFKTVMIGRAEADGLVSLFEFCVLAIVRSVLDRRFGLTETRQTQNGLHEAQNAIQYVLTIISRFGSKGSAVNSKGSELEEHPTSGSAALQIISRALGKPADEALSNSFRMSWPEFGTHLAVLQESDQEVRRRTFKGATELSQRDGVITLNEYSVLVLLGELLEIPLPAVI